jgi:RNA polymerase sigma-70 factor (ECF subfamily)
MLDQDPKNLIIEAKRGDARAFEALYRLYFTPVFRYLYARTWSKEVAEDVAQTTFVKAYAGLSGWRDMGKNPLAYFFTIARNALHDHWRGDKEISVEDETLERSAGVQPSHDTDIDRSLSGELLKRTLAELSDDQREVMTMRYFGELEYHEIADATGKEEPAVRQLHCRALKLLRGKIQGL